MKYLKSVIVMVLTFGIVAQPMPFIPNVWAAETLNQVAEQEIMPVYHEGAEVRLFDLIDQKNNLAAFKHENGNKIPKERDEEKGKVSKEDRKAIKDLFNRIAHTVQEKPDDGVRCLGPGCRAPGPRESFFDAKGDLIGTRQKVFYEFSFIITTNWYDANGKLVSSTTVDHSSDSIAILEPGEAVPNVGNNNLLLQKKIRIKNEEDATSVVRKSRRN